MTVKINADTTNGAVITSDTSGEIELQAGGTKIATVKSTGLEMATGKTIPSSALTGALPAISGASLTNLPAASELSTASGSAPSYSARAWVSWDGGSTGVSTIFGSANVSSVTDNGTGDSTINFTTALPNANYAVVGMCTGYSNYNSTLMVYASANGSGNQNPTTKTTSSVRVGYGHSNTVTRQHVGYLSVIVIG